ncbi:MAG: AAA family ATPase [Solirubrobacterales bacterium]
MARFVDPPRSRENIDQLVELWKERCLLGDGSLLFDGRAVWSLANLQDFRDRFTGSAAIYGTGENFEEKLEKQLADASDDVRLLAAELLVVHFLFAYVAIGTEAKIAIVREAAGSAWEDKAPGWELVEAALGEGIGNPGSGYNIRRDIQVSYLLDFAIRWKALSAEDQLAKLADPWALRDFADDAGEDVPVREMRHILLHLLRPEEFERISSGTHKQQIADAFRGEFLDGDDAPEDLDEQLLRIRRALEGLRVQPDLDGGTIDFYFPPLNGIWKPDTEGEEGTSDLTLLLHKKHLVFFGPPGTSKTHRTRALADSLIRRAALEKWGANRFFADQDRLAEMVEENIEWVQLHSGFGYEEFIRGLRLEGDRTVYAPGLLLRVVERMADRGEDGLPVVLVLDEINRTDLSRMFGEAFSLLESRGSSAVLPGIDPGGNPVELRLPDDLYVIGTMNLIDQSVEQMDFALRRRFLWRPCGFEPGPIIDVNRERWPDYAPKRYGWDRAEEDIGRLAERAEALNREISSSNHLGEQYALGHTYYFDAAFLIGTWLQGRKQLRGGVLWRKPGKPQRPLEDLWTLSLKPVLDQYLEGIDPTAAREEIERLRDVLFGIEGS